MSDLLAAIAVPEPVIARELALFGPLIVSNTASPSLIGVLNNFVVTIRHYASGAPPINPLDLALRLAKTPFKPIGYAFPADVALARLGLPKKVWPFPGGAT